MVFFYWKCFLGREDSSITLFVGMIQSVERNPSAICSEGNEEEDEKTSIVFWEFFSGRGLEFIET
jgi:hypothetical protein